VNESETWTVDTVESWCRKSPGFHFLHDEPKADTRPRSYYSFCKLYCHSVACQLWTQQANTNYASGQRNCAANIPECQSACIVTAGCNGFDWVPKEQVLSRCWLSGTWSGARSSVQGVTHYVLDRNCAGNDFFKCNVNGQINYLHFNLFKEYCFSHFSSSCECVKTYKCKKNLLLYNNV